MTDIDVRNQVAWGQELQRRQLHHPDERVVTFLATNYPDGRANQGHRALDIGYGSGRHLRLLADRGFRVTGLEFADGAREVALDGFDAADPPELVDADLRDAPFADGTFTVAVAWGALFLRRLADMGDDLRTAFRLLAPGGRLLANFRTPENWFAGLGEHVDGPTWLLDDRAGAYTGMTYTFLDQQACLDLCRSAGFEVENLERVELWKHHATERHAWWVVWLRRPEVSS